MDNRIPFLRYWQKRWSTRPDCDDEKNQLLKQTRGIGFEDIIVAVHEGDLLDIVDHPNKVRYPNQRIYLVACRNYIYAVPFVPGGETDEIFLKTIFPSRRYTKLYLQAGGGIDE